MSDPSPDTPERLRTLLQGTTVTRSLPDPALRWRCPHCFPELFPDAVLLSLVVLFRRHRPRRRTGTPSSTLMPTQPVRHR